MRKLFEDWASPLEIEGATIALKLVRVEKITAGDVERIEILPQGLRLRHTNTPDPQSSLQAKFNVQYVTARAHG